MDRKNNTLKLISSLKVITYVENKSSFCLTIINWEWVSLIKVISGDKEKQPIYMMFKGLNIKSAWIELIKNINGEAKKWGDIEMTRKR